MKKKAALFWSGGKDSGFALYKVQMDHPELDVCFLITTLNKEYKRISMHGVPEELLDRQAEAVGIPLQKMWVPNEPTNSAYELKLHETLLQLKESGIETIVFGDIFLEDLRQYRDNILHEHGLTGVYPLWKNETLELIHNFISLGFRAITCCVSIGYMNGTWLGKEINETFIRELPSGIDPCGENGEFHTFVFDGPIFKKPVSFLSGEKIIKEFPNPKNEKGSLQPEKIRFWYIDLITV